MSGHGFPGIGLGFDAHQFGGGRALVVGGVVVDHPRGLIGHSDADVLCHAVGDALLGAAGMGDLGERFPSSDSRWAGASSIEMLRQIVALLEAAGLEVLGVDGTVVAEAPRLAPYRAQMVTAVAGALGLSPERVSVKVKSSDGMGFSGRGEGMAALAVSSVGRREPGSSRIP